ncbi:MAG: sterol desaturase family protein [Polyangiales bacterium]
MLHRLWGLPDEPLVILLSLTLTGYAFFFALACLMYAFFFVWGRKRFHPKHQPDWRENRRALAWSAASVAGNALLMLPMHVLIAQGHSKVYYDVAEHGWAWLIASAVIIICVSETMTYWVHRALHWGKIYDWLHKPHHSFRVPTPFVGVAFNPLDSFAQALPHHLCVFLFPVHVGVYTTFITFITIWAVMIHDRISIMPWRGVNYTSHHTLHHWYYNYNFGQFFTFWDRLAGTYKDPESCYDDVPNDVLRPHLVRSWWARRKQSAAPLRPLPAKRL